MSKTYEEILAGASTIKNERSKGANSASRIGQQFVDQAEYAKEVADRTTDLELEIYGKKTYTEYHLGDWQNGTIKSTNKWETGSSITGGGYFIKVTGAKKIKYSISGKTCYYAFLKDNTKVNATLPNYSAIVSNRQTMNNASNVEVDIPNDTNYIWVLSNSNGYDIDYALPQLFAIDDYDVISNEYIGPIVSGGLKDEVAKKQNTLVSGDNIKTINGGTILGGGDIAIPATYIKNQTIRSIAHRGLNGGLYNGGVVKDGQIPENHFAAWTRAIKEGFDVIECDVNCTSDHVPVILHDNSINRTARNADGSEIATTKNIRDITFEEALTYDFGIAWGEKWKGLKIPTLNDFLECTKKLGCEAYIEIKNGTGSEITSYYTSVKSFGLERRVTWISTSLSSLNKIKTIDDSARLGLIAQNGITNEVVINVISLRTATNEVFINTGITLADESSINLAKSNGVSVEVYSANVEEDVLNASPYISGMTGDYFSASKYLKESMFDTYWPN